MSRKLWWSVVILLGTGALILPARAQGPESSPAVLGVDLSYVNEMEDCGGEFRAGGEPVDPFALFAQSGATLVRVRLWHTPTWTQYSTLDDVKKTIARAKAEGLAVLLDFHYSDTWADPSKQIIPAAWAEITDTEALAQAVYDYTAGVLADLDAAGLMPDIVQVGNEINTEILRGEGESGYPIRWERNARLINAGIQAVRDAGGPQVMLHIAKPEEVEGWLLAAMRAGVTDFDIIGVSYYPGWSNFPVSAVGALVNKLRHQFGADVLIAETAYPWTLSGVAESAGNILGRDFLLPDYPATPAGQKQFLIDLTQAVLTNGGLGIVYWEPAWISTPCRTLWGQGSHWENATFFDFGDGNNVHEGIDWLSHNYALPLRVMFQVRVDPATAPEGVYISGDFTGMGRRLLPLESADAAYTLDDHLMAASTVTYGFFAGPRRDAQEALDPTCADADGLRTLTVPDADACIVHTFGACAVEILPYPCPASGP